MRPGVTPFVGVVLNVSSANGRRANAGCRRHTCHQFFIPKGDSDVPFGFLKNGDTLVLEGDKGHAKLIKCAEILVGNHANSLAHYVNTALEIFDILYSQQANAKEIPVSQHCIEHITNYAVKLRDNPEHQNGALIVAAGLRDTKFVKNILDMGRKQGKVILNQHNGAAVNYKGYFSDTAAVWSAILLDKDTLEVLPDNDASTSQLGISESSLLHWAVVAAQLDDSTERKIKAQAVIELLLQYRLGPMKK